MRNFNSKNNQIVMIENLKKIHSELGGLSSPVIHIAGSKGKGTTAFLLAKILEMSGRKVGMFSSPAIFRIEEMIQVNGIHISEEKLKEYMTRVPALREGLSEFESITLAGLAYFEDEGCDFVILECGWGGAKDATNAVERKALTILTHIELEHTDVLGQTIPEIAAEKIGICRQDVPLLTVASQVPEVFDEIEEAGFSTTIVPSRDLGYHHPESVGLAVAAAEQLGITINDEILSALERLQIPGRFEITEWGMHTLVLDGAHTFNSIRYVRERVLEYAQNKGLADPLWGIHFLSDKQKDLWKLFPVQRTIWAEIDHPRAGDTPGALPSATVTEIFEQLKAEQTPKLLVFVGSFRLVAAVKEELLKNPSRLG
jgi:folylpolyglutamate synthase/dihydropteroate synthase